MKERPILFQGEMVRALLAGTKTQTRRMVKWRGLEPGLNLGFSGLSVERSGSNFVLTSPTRTSHEYRSVPQPCPYGQPGDRLWVRETFYAFGRWETRFSEKKGRDEWHFIDMTLETGHAYCYAADGGVPALLATRRASGMTPAWWKRPAIHMPRSAGRILLDVVGAGAERVQAISLQAVRAEGCEVREFWLYGSEGEERRQVGARVYRRLWESINGAGSWDANPWVWAVEFRRTQP